MGKKNEERLLPDNIYKKSNTLISAYFKSTITENKIMAIALSNQKRMIQDAGGTVRVSIPVAEIRDFIGGNSGSFYATLKEAANSLNKRQIGIIDDVNGQFAFYQMIQTCRYVDGVLHMTFNSDMSHVIKDFSDNFTPLNLKTMMSFKSEYSFRLYELIKSHSYNRDKKSTNTTWVFDFQLAELFLQIGIVDAEDEKAKKELNNKKHPDYEKAITVADDKNKKKSLLDWNTFKKTVLNKAIKEINEKTEYSIEYKTKKQGQGGKVKGVRFTVNLKNVMPTEQPEQKIVLSEDEKFDFMSELKELFDIPDIKTSSIRAIAEASDWDMNKCKKAFNIVSSKNNVMDFVGYMIAAIREDFDEPVKQKPKKKKNSFNDFEQNEYSQDIYDAIEKASYT